MNKTLRASALAVLAATCFSAQAQVHITEWMYGGPGSEPEFIEFTNLGGTAVDFSGWSFDDDSRSPGIVNLSAFGLVGAGESVILAEASATDFRTLWSLPASVKVIGDNTTNLSRNDEINLYDSGNALVDRLTFGDQNLPGTIRTQDFSGNPGSLAVLASQTSAGWVLSSLGDTFGSYASTNSFYLGNPGTFALAVPEPETYALMLGGLAVVGGLARRCSRRDEE